MLFISTILVISKPTLREQHLFCQMNGGFYVTFLLDVTWSLDKQPKTELNESHGLLKDFQSIETVNVHDHW